MEIEVACPFPGCDHVSRHDDAAIVVELLKIHGLTHSAAATPGGNMNKLKRPTVSLAGTSETWSHASGETTSLSSFWSAVTTI